MGSVLEVSSFLMGSILEVGSFLMGLHFDGVHT